MNQSSKLAAKCIYCGSENLSQEHHLPRCLGNFKSYVSLNDRVCEDCNGNLGKLDEQLCKSGVESFFRQFLGIQGRKSHKHVNPFYRGSSGGGRLEMRAVHPETKEDVQLEMVSPGYKKEVLELCHLKLIADDGSQYVIPILDDMTPEEFRRRFDAIGIKHFKEGYLSAPPDEIPRIEQLMATLKIDRRTEWELAKPVEFTGATIKVTLTSRYFRAIAKIAFHYFLTKCPQFHGSEDCFSDIRKFISSECTLAECARFVGRSRKPIVYEIHLGAKITVWGHLLTAEMDYSNLVGRVQLFLGPTFMPEIYTVRLGRNPSSLHYAKYYADFFEYYPPDEREEFDGEIFETIGLFPTKR
jgi:hypothetical protein